MVTVDIAVISSWVALIASVCTFLQGFLYLILKIVDLRLEFGDCGFFEEDCNGVWRSVFTFRPSILLDIWTPLLVGLVGMALHLKSLKTKYMTNYLQYALFMLVTALFANFGYVGGLGIILGTLSLLACVLCIVTRLTGEKTMKTLELGPDTLPAAPEG
mmetsp:Transcript_108143/g.305762  ORF Transcript_108143/g.305762 Transcript_108143/m.305762 type:complete len:159 (-) Transcript_108143:50-526(-)